MRAPRIIMPGAGDERNARAALLVRRGAADAGLAIVRASITAALNGHVHRRDIRDLVEQCIADWEATGQDSIPTRRAVIDRLELAR